MNTSTVFLHPVRQQFQAFFFFFFFLFSSLASAPENKRLGNISLQLNTIQFSYVQELLLCAHLPVENIYPPISEGDL